MNKSIDHIPNSSNNTLTAYSWPGNIRELRNVIDRAMIVSAGSCLNISMHVSETDRQMPLGKTLRDREYEQILSTLVEAKWQVGGKNGAVKLLGLMS